MICYSSSHRLNNLVLSLTTLLTLELSPSRVFSISGDTNWHCTHQLKFCEVLDGTIWIIIILWFNDKTLESILYSTATKLRCHDDQSKPPYISALCQPAEAAFPSQRLGEAGYPGWDRRSVSAWSHRTRRQVRPTTWVAWPVWQRVVPACWQWRTRLARQIRTGDIWSSRCRWPENIQINYK